MYKFTGLLMLRFCAFSVLMLCVNAYAVDHRMNEFSSVSITLKRPLVFLPTRPNDNHSYLFVSQGKVGYTDPTTVNREPECILSLNKPTQEWVRVEAGQVLTSVGFGIERLPDGYTLAIRMTLDHPVIAELKCFRLVYKELITMTQFSEAMGDLASVSGSLSAGGSASCEWRPTVTAPVATIVSE